MVACSVISTHRMKAPDVLIRRFHQVVGACQTSTDSLWRRLRAIVIIIPHPPPPPTILSIPFSLSSIPYFTPSLSGLSIR